MSVPGGDRAGERLVDTRYYEAAGPTSLGERMIVAARDRIYEDFLRVMRPSADDLILDVGASDVVNDAANLLERKYPAPAKITAVGLGEARTFQETFPEVTYRKVEAGAPLPFPDRAFDVATSNAVIEHVGSRAGQKAFVGELVRVARRVFVTAPHRYFPVEHHTAMPLMHFWRPAFEAACKASGKTYWLDEANLILMDRAGLAAAAPPGRCLRIGYTGLMLGPFSSNIFLAIDPPG